MSTSTRRLGLLMLLGIAACNDSGPSTSPEQGAAAIHVIHTGSAPVASAYRLSLDDSILFTGATADSLLLEAISPGAHAIALEPLAPSCIPDWYVPQPITITSGQTSTVTFTLRCDNLTAPGIIFASSRDNFRRDIYRMNPDGANVQRLTTTPLGADFPVVSPGGTRVAFQRQAQVGLEQIWLMDVDGGSAVKLTTSTLLEQAPAWAPDGRRLAFIRWTQGDVRSLIIASADGRAEQTLVEGRVSDSTAPFSPLWSPDGRSIAVGVGMGTRYGIRVIDIATKTSRDLLPANDTLEALPLTWTPDGNLLYCRLQRHPAELCDAVISPVDGSAEVVLVPALPGLVTAAYTADGTTIALTAYGPTFVFDVFRIAATGGALTNLTDNITPLSQDLFPSWVP